MYGVVLWLDKKAQKAVIWCEDHGDVAIADGAQCKSEIFDTGDTGDLVFVAFRDAHPLRICTQLQLIQKRVCVDLQDRLKTCANTAVRVGKNSALCLPGI